jgi:predicted nucleotide-binding protein (sugar kinase/HSP70/actin superfamily)
MMPTTCGPCRFGQYRTLQRLVFDEVGLHDLEIVSPNSENGYQGLGDGSMRLRRLAWQGMVAIDLLLMLKLCYEYRSLACRPQEADAVYDAALRRVLDAIEAGGGRVAVQAMAWAGAQFASLALDRRQRRPWIGIVGEIYLRANPFTNQEIVRQVEALGGRVWMAPMMEWFYFSLWGTQMRARQAGNLGAWLKAVLTEWVQRYDEHRLLRPVQKYLTYPHEAPVGELMNHVRPYYHPGLGTEAPLSMGKAIDLARCGLSGVIHVLPFSCMPGIVVTGLREALRADHGRIPWLDVIYDAQGETNIQTRLEAFMHQARQFQARSQAAR